ATGSAVKFTDLTAAQQMAYQLSDASAAAQHWKARVEIYDGNTKLTSNDLDIATYALNPLIVHCNSSTAYLDPLSDLSVAKCLSGASIGSGTIQVPLSLLDPLAPNQPQRTKAYPRSVGTVMAIGLDANQLSDQFLASLESKTNADALSVRSGQSTFD